MEVRWNSTAEDGAGHINGENRQDMEEQNRHKIVGLRVSAPAKGRAGVTGVKDLRGGTMIKRHTKNN